MIFSPDGWVDTRVKGRIDGYLFGYGGGEVIQLSKGPSSSVRLPGSLAHLLRDQRKAANAAQMGVGKLVVAIL
jgi:hypothetical protein